MYVHVCGAGIYQFHWSQYLAPGIENSVRCHLVGMYQRVGEKELGGFITLKRVVQLHSCACPGSQTRKGSLHGEKLPKEAVSHSRGPF